MLKGRVPCNRATQVRAAVAAMRSTLPDQHRNSAYEAICVTLGVACMENLLRS